MNFRRFFPADLYAISLNICRIKGQFRWEEVVLEVVGFSIELSLLPEVAMLNRDTREAVNGTMIPEKVMPLLESVSVGARALAVILRLCEKLTLIMQGNLFVNQIERLSISQIGFSHLLELPSISESFA